MFKRIISVLVCLCLMPTFFGCGNRSGEISPSAETTNELPKPLLLDDGIILPPWVEPSERNGVNYHYSYPDSDIVSAVKLSDGIVRGRVGNFIKEDRYAEGMGNTTFEVEITKCIKGSFSDTVRVVWDAYSEGGSSKVKLPFYGDELLLFLKKDETDDEYSLYCDIDFDIVSLDGTEYCVSGYDYGVIYQLSQLLPDYPLDEYPELADKVLAKLNERIVYWNERTGRSYFMTGKNTVGEIYLLSDLIFLIEYISIE